LPLGHARWARSFLIKGVQMISAFRWGSLAVALSAVAGSGTVLAAGLTFNFDAVTIPTVAPFNPQIVPSQGATGNGNTGCPTGAAPCVTGAASSIQGVMNTQLGLGSGVVAFSGGFASNGYTGDNHVVTTNSGGLTGTAGTLAQYGNVAGDKTLHTFVMNDNFSLYGTAQNQFQFKFNGIGITSVSFKWEIFPDGSCVNTNCGAANMPALSFFANNGTLGGNGKDIANFATTLGTAGPNASGITVAPQGIGTSTTYDLTTSFATGATSLTFVDWPAEVAIRDLKITYVCTNTSLPCNRQNVPEPDSLSLLGAALVGAGLVFVRRRRRPSA